MNKKKIKRILAIASIAVVTVCQSVEAGSKGHYGPWKKQSDGVSEARFLIRGIGPKCLFRLVGSTKVEDGDISNGICYVLPR